MAEFTATVYQNEFLPDGGTDVNAIVTVNCIGAGEAGSSGDEGEMFDGLVILHTPIAHNKVRGRN